MSLSLTKPTQWPVCPAKTPISLCIRPVWSESSLFWVISYPLSAQRRLWSDWAEALADLSLRWAHMSICWFCRAAALIVSECFLLLWCRWQAAVYARSSALCLKPPLVLYKWAASCQNQQTDMCAAKWRLRSAWASAQSDQSSLSAWRKFGSLGLTTYPCFR